jgi:hypothetical protein
VFDRGYPAFWLFAAMQARGIDFCVRVVLDSGEAEVLVTSLLDTSAFPAAELKGLYHLRWPVESYKRDKHALRFRRLMTTPSGTQGSIRVGS